MKRLIYIIMVFALAYSCQKYDDAWISNEFGIISENISDLEALCVDYNKEIVAVHSVIQAIEKNDMITDLLYQPEANSLTLTFRDMGLVKLTITEGKNGKETDKIPVVSLRKDSDDLWYWTIDGEWCKDPDGNKVPTLGNTDVTPMIKIDNDYWWVSYDGGVEWKKLYKATGKDGEDAKDGDLMISSFTSDDQMVHITLQSGEQLMLPMASPLVLNISSPSDDITPGQVFKLSFEIKGSMTRPELTCIGEHGWKASVKWDTDTEGELVVYAPEVLSDGKIVVFATCGEYTVIKAVNFHYDTAETKVMSIVNDFFEVDGGGGVVNIKLTTNQAYRIEIPESAKEWISHVRTKSVREDDILLSISANKPGNPSRTAIVSFVGDGINVSVTISQRSMILLDSEIELGPTDGFDNTSDGIVVLQTATRGKGTDIILMGDGFSKRDFVLGNNYRTVMEQAYEDFFSVEPYASLKDYFNVYYINAVSEDPHDAQPYYDSAGNQNGAVNGTANTCFSTVFTPGSTSISGNKTAIDNYARQAIRYKGGPGGTACTSESEVSTRVNRALMIVMINVKCHAGTCYFTWTRSTADDYANSYSIAYCPLGHNGDREQRRWTLIHEAGGHGFGKLNDEYEVSSITSFSTSDWTELSNLHSYGVDRNINEYWTAEEAIYWPTISWTYTTNNNVYWAELLQSNYSYAISELLGVYKGGNAYSNMFCRPTPNSVMRNQRLESGHFFNAISRWAIWYRLMRLTQSTSSTNFKASLNEFIEFDKTLSIDCNSAHNNTYNLSDSAIEYMPLGKPVKQEVVLVGDRLVPVGQVLK